MHILKKILVSILIVLVLFFCYIAIARSGKTPSNTRNWTTDQALLPHVTMTDSLISIDNVRDFEYTSTSEFIPHYLSKTVDLNALTSVDYLIEPFGTNKGAAHTLLSFGFETPTGTDYIAISVEIRKEVGEQFSPWRGILNEFEIMYVISTEDDVIKLRTNYRHDPVYLYPIATTKERMQALFVSMIHRAQTLEDTPEFYNTLTNNCTTNIRDHVNEILPGRIPWTYTTLLPGYSGKRAYELGLIDTDLSFVEAQQQFYITDIAQAATGREDFSTLIRSKR